MATIAQLTAEQYFAMYFEEREPEFVRGELVERPMPTWSHSRIQHLLLLSLDRVGYCAPELRMQLADDVVRIPDVAVLSAPPPDERAPSSPPFLVVEVSSPDERFQNLLRKLEEYRVWGVTHIWVVEPELKEFHIYSASGLARVTQFELPEFDFRLNAAELFARVSAR